MNCTVSLLCVFPVDNHITDEEPGRPLPAGGRVNVGNLVQTRRVANSGRLENSSFPPCVQLDFWTHEERIDFSTEADIGVLPFDVTPIGNNDR